ncbi:MAG: hypothetical protein HQL64_07585 [Magnetococcales bacterium]|nr:hypothetical protein [Magnetococcales bacterium]
MTTTPQPVDSGIATAALLVTLREALTRTPHARGDHTDLCRHHHAGLPPRELEQCRCHVAWVTRALTTPAPRAEAILETIRAARDTCQVLTGPSSPEAAAQALARLQKALSRLDDSGEGIPGSL